MRARLKLLLQATFATAQLCALIAVTPFGGVGDAQVPLGSEIRRPVAVSDTIEMSQFAAETADYDYAGSGSTTGVVQYSPDGSRFVFLQRKGNLIDNTNEYSLLLWETKDLSAAPLRVLTMASSSNRPAMEQVRWLNNQTLLFLGEHSGEVHELYRMDLATQSLAQVTHSASNVLAYDFSVQAEEVVYFAEQKAARPLFDVATRNSGLLVTTQSLLNLARGRAEPSQEIQLLAEPMYPHQDQVRIIRDAIPAVAPGATNAPIISPDGRYIATMVRFTQAPDLWTQYGDDYGDFIKKIVKTKLNQGEYSQLGQYQIVELATGQAKWAVNAPIFSRNALAWAPDSRSVVICGTYLPLTGIDDLEKSERIKKTYCAEVDVENGALAKVTEDSAVALKAWDQKNGDLLLYANVTRFIKVPVKGSPIIAYRKENGTWRKAFTQAPAAEDSKVVITLKEGMNQPPHLMAEDIVNHHTADLLDLNPQFKQLQLGKEELFKYTDKLGHGWTGGLYYPVDYQSGKRYPLVIQTHDFNPNKFWIVGPYTTSYAAQPLAGRGMFVLQLEELAAYEGSVLNAQSSINEVKFHMAEYESAIDELDNRGLIDRQHVGIMGFSRTCWYVKYILTHSHYHIAAASVADGVDYGYVQDSVINFFDGDSILGGRFWGPSRSNWLKESPGFNLDKVHTPLYIIAARLEGAILDAEWFSGLRRLNKPVEFVLLAEDGDHPVVKPWEIRVSAQGSVEWFDFWLKGEENPDSAKKEQYSRWHELRSLHEQQAKRTISQAVH